MAQWIAHQTSDLRVVGSSPIVFECWFAILLVCWEKRRETRNDAYLLVGSRSMLDRYGNLPDDELSEKQAAAGPASVLGNKQVRTCTALPALPQAAAYTDTNTRFIRA